MNPLPKHYILKIKTFVLTGRIPRLYEACQSFMDQNAGEDKGSFRLQFLVLKYAKVSSGVSDLTAFWKANKAPTLIFGTTLA